MANAKKYNRPDALVYHDALQLEVCLLLLYCATIILLYMYRILIHFSTDNNKLQSPHNDLIFTIYVPQRTIRRVHKEIEKEFEEECDEDIMYVIV